MSSLLKSKKMIAFYYVSLIGLFLLISLVVVFGKKETKMVEVQLKGEQYQSISLNTNYEDRGFKIQVGDEELDIKDVDYKIENNIDEKVIGKYEVDYEINYDNKKYNLKRYIEVVDDEEPVISVNQDYVETYYCKKTNKINLDYTAEDNYDGIITDRVKVEMDKDKAILSVKDSAGNEAVKEVPVKKINDESVAIIELVGKEKIYLKVGSEYVEQGASLTDGCGKKRDEDLDISGDVDINTPGEYVITYKYESESGVVTTKTRTVIVYKSQSGEVKQEQGEKIVYLTFDDGPGKYTDELLDILKKYDVKATFFVTNQFKKYVPLIKREYEEGHVVAVHTLTHKWEIYRSVETYIKDFNDMNEIVFKYTGERSKLFRFPGGSSNTVSRRYSTGVVSMIASKMNEYGYTYFDWNVDSEDAAGASKERIYKNVIKGINDKSVAVVLMHDIKKNTISVIEDIIVYGIENGYTFKTLTSDSITVHHRINN